MNKLFLFLVFSCFSVNIYSQSNEADMILGDWISPKNDVIVQCYKKNNMYYGKIVWFKKYYYNLKYDPNAVPERNWLNIDVISKFKYKDNEWSDGQIFALKKGKTYEGFIKMKDINTMEVTGFAYIRMLSETLYFTRYLEKELPKF
jgi:uncharacterized protein (DUF2147 family)